MLSEAPQIRERTFDHTVDAKNGFPVRYTREPAQRRVVRHADDVQRFESLPKIRDLSAELDQGLHFGLLETPVEIDLPRLQPCIKDPPRLGIASRKVIQDQERQVAGGSTLRRV